MKSRSEVLAEKRKSSAAERTVPLPLEQEETKKEEKPTPPAANGTTITCEACESELEIAKLKKRSDGAYECSECAAPIAVDKKQREAEREEAKPKKSSKPMNDEAEEPEESESGARSGSFCGDCGAEWPVVKGKTTINCGHVRALRVDDPRKATNMKKNTASGVPNVPDAPPSVNAPPRIAEPSVVIQGNRISVGWGETSFPFGEVTNGPKFANFKVPQQIITVELPAGADRVEATRAIVADLMRIADLVFDAEYTWYKKRLRSLDAK